MMEPLDPQIDKPPKQFPSYLGSNNNNINGLSSRARTVCEMLARVYPGEVETALTTLGMNLEPEVVEQVLKNSYACPETAVIFFNWVGLRQKRTALMWNLVVDLLGKNKMFDQMWEAIRSMKVEGVLSLTTFVSVFGSYCDAGKFTEAEMSFGMMEGLGVRLDVVAVNALLSAMCRDESQVMKANAFFENIKTRIPPDGDTYAILLEGWEKEGNVGRVKTMFGEMVVRVGWSPQYVSAYDTFLITLFKGLEIDEALKFLKVMKGKKCLPSVKFYSVAVDVLVQQNDSAKAILLWDTMMDSELTPSLVMCNAMIGLLCKNDEISKAYEIIDKMPYYGVFADSVTYNLIFQYLVKNKKVKEAGRFYNEMVKNEQPPSAENCADAILLFFERDDPEMAYEIWLYVKKDNVTPIDASANALLIGLAGLGRLSELRRNAEKFFKGRVKIHEYTMEKVKTACKKEGRKACEMYDDLDRKWRYS